MARVGFIGLGNMGGGMAANLAKAGHDVRAYDLSEDALARAKAAGCLPVASAAVLRAACTASAPEQPSMPFGRAGRNEASSSSSSTRDASGKSREARQRARARAPRAAHGLRHATTLWDTRLSL